MKTLLHAVLALLLLAGTGCATRPTHTAAPPVLLISVDGLRADAVGSGRMPTLDALANDGVRAAWMTPSYPTLTFPNHYTLVTGLRPDRHGLVNNSMSDPLLGKFKLSLREAVQDRRWWDGGEPVWVTLQQHGGRAATMFWPGSEAPIHGRHPSYWHIFNDKVDADARVDQVLEWLDLPTERRPQFLTLYFDQVDHAGHDAGPASDAAQAAMAEVDAALARLLTGLRQRGLRDAINLVVVSDHGMADASQREYLSDYLQPHGLSLDAITVVTAGPMAGIAPKPAQQAAVERALLGRHQHATCWRKLELPAHWQYGRHARVPPIVCQADTGWFLLDRDRGQAAKTGGAHGYAPEDPSMRAIFVADGPAFKDGVEIPAFDNVDVYPLLMHLLHLPPRPNDGRLAPLQPALRDGR